MARVVPASFALFVALSGAGCTLITDVDRSRIPQPPEPPVVTPDADLPADAEAPDAAPAAPDSGPGVETPDSGVLDSGVPDASPGEDGLDAGASVDAS